MTRDPHLRLTRLLSEHAGPDATLVETSAEPWASVTFDGMRHRLLFAVRAGESCGLAHLTVGDFVLPGHLLADLALTECGRQDGLRLVECAALTVQEA